MKIQIKRKEVGSLISGLGQVKGMTNFMKAISLGRDLRALKALQDENEAAIKACKPEGYDELHQELQELVRTKAKEYKVKDAEILNESAITAHVLLTWEKSAEWRDLTKQYNQNIENISNQAVEFDAHTELEEKDVPKCAEDIAVAEVLALFMK